MKKKNNKSILPVITARLISFYIHLCGYLTRYIHTGDAASMEFSRTHQGIYAFWHNQQSFLLFPYRKRGKVAVLVSMSKDGEFMAKALPKFNMVAVRGSTSRGGFRALRGLIESATKGYSPAITPDGPRGPIYKAQPGILYLAQKTNLPIIAAGVASSRVIEAKSWDRFQIPLPFGKCAIVYGAPIIVKQGEDINVAAKLLTDTLNIATAKAKELVA